MLKHRFSALMIFHDAETPLCSTVHFSDAETPMLCSTVHFSDAETPLKNTGDCFPDAETPLIGTFHFFPVTKTSHSLIILTPETTPSSTCFAFSPSSAATPSAATFPVAETPIVSNFSSVPPMLKHHCSAFFIPFPSSFSPPSSTKQFRPAIVSPLLLLKHHLPATLHHSSTLLKHHLPATFHHSSMMLKHHRSAPSDFLPILKHQLSAVLHR
jgi:hypothetical protein